MDAIKDRIIAALWSLAPRDGVTDATDAVQLLADATHYLGEREWRPIESAPKDGTRILLWTANMYAITGAFRDYIPERPDWRSDSGAEMVPRYWMPLPPPPQAAKE